MSRKLTPPFRLILKRQDRIDYVLAGACNYFKISLKDLKKINNSGDTLPKRFAIKALRDVSDVSFKEIGYVFSITGNAAFVNYQKTTADLDRKTYGNSEMKSKYADFLNRLEY